MEKSPLLTSVSTNTKPLPFNVNTLSASRNTASLSSNSSTLTTPVAACCVNFSVFVTERMAAYAFYLVHNSSALKLYALRKDFMLL